MAAVEAYIAPQQGNPDFAQSAVTPIRDYGFRIVQQAKSGLSADQSESSDMTIVSENGADRPSMPPMSTVHDVQLFAVLCPGVCILTEDVMNNASFMSCVKSAQTPILYFDHLRKQYTMYKQRERQSALKRELEEIDAAISAVVNEIKKAADVKLSPSLGLATLAKSCTYKQQLLTNIAQSFLTLKSKVSSTTLLNNLRHRLKQQKATTSEDYNVDCFRIRLILHGKKLTEH